MLHACIRAELYAQMQNDPDKEEAKFAADSRYTGYKKDYDQSRKSTTRTSTCQIRALATSCICTQALTLFLYARSLSQYRPSILQSLWALQCSGERCFLRGQISLPYGVDADYEVDFVTFFTQLASVGAKFNPDAYLKPIDSLVTRL